MEQKHQKRIPVLGKMLVRAMFEKATQLDANYV
jgi:hypothetical protein